MAVPTPVSSISALTHAEAIGLQEAELQRTLDLLRGLEPEDWRARTDCPDWDVREMYLHVLGALEGSASPLQGMHQMRAARKRRKERGGPLEANLSAIQVADREPMSHGELVERLSVIGPKGIRRRRKLLGFRRHMKIGVDGPVVEKWTLGYLIDTIYLRDLWMHRIDAARATGRDLVLTAEHDGRLVADVVAEWARRHGQPFTLELTGPAGGQFISGSGDAPAISMDAMEFCRTLAGRATGAGLLATIVPF